MDECIGITEIFLRDFEPSSEPRRLTCSLLSEYNPKVVVGQVTVLVAFKQVSKDWNPEIQEVASSGTCKSSSNLYKNRKYDSLNQSANKNAQNVAFLGEKPIQPVTPRIQLVIDDGGVESDGSYPSIKSVRGRTNSIHDICKISLPGDPELSLPNLGFNEIMTNSAKSPHSNHNEDHTRNAYKI